MAREFTVRLYEMVDNGLLDADQVMAACLAYMSEDDVKEMMEMNEFLLDEEDEQDEDEYDDSMDGDARTALASAGFGTDEDYGSYSDE